jgi:hypothetical protein
VLSACKPATDLCLASDLTLPSESVATRTIARWLTAPPDIDRRPTVFLLGAATGPAGEVRIRAHADARRRARRF